MEMRIRELERGHDRQSGKLDLMESQLSSIVSWTKKRDERAEWLSRAIIGAVVVAIVAWVLAGGLIGA